MQRLMQDIKSGQFNHIYLLYGEEGYLRRQYRDKLKEAVIGDDNMNYHYYEGKDISFLKERGRTRRKSSTWRRPCLFLLKGA